MRVLFIAVLLTLGIANGIYSLTCGFRIQQSGNGDVCYLNAGHQYQNIYTGQDIIEHGLNGYDEYNVFWQCSGSSATTQDARVWYYERPHPSKTSLAYPGTAFGSRIFTVLPDRNMIYGPYYLDRDGTRGQGDNVDYGEVEFNAKCDKLKYDTPILFGMYGHPYYGILGTFAGAGKYASFRLERDRVYRGYDTVTGERVKGAEAKWQYTVTDRSGTTDNVIRLIPVNCGKGVYINKADEYPATDPNPSGLLIEIPANINYIQTIFIGVLLVSLMSFCVCAYTRKSPEKVKYKSVKFDSDTDAV